MRILAVFAALAFIVAVPFALKPKDDLLAKADDTIVIITPHNEQIRYEFSRAFGDYYKTDKRGARSASTGGCRGEPAKSRAIIKGEYYAAFERMWKSAGREWTAEAAATFDDPKAQSEARRAVSRFRRRHRDRPLLRRRSFRLSATGRRRTAGRLRNPPEPPRLVRETTQFLTPFPERFFTMQDGRWIGTVLSSFGICYNSDSLRRLGVGEIPSAWSDLGNPRFFKQVALADPTKSGSAAKAFEMIIQQQIQEAIHCGGMNRRRASLQLGWARGLQIIQRASANARYFTDAASQVPVDVSLGDAAIGMCIDFYGRFQSEAIRVANTPSRLQYFTPAGGSSVGVDPIALFRGAPNPEAAKMFIEFVLSLEGQKLWDFKVGAPGGPSKICPQAPAHPKGTLRFRVCGLPLGPGGRSLRGSKIFHVSSEVDGPAFQGHELHHSHHVSRQS